MNHCFSCLIYYMRVKHRFYGMRDENEIQVKNIFDGGTLAGIRILTSVWSCLSRPFLSIYFLMFISVCMHLLNFQSTEATVFHQWEYFWSICFFIFESDFNVLKVDTCSICKRTDRQRSGECVNFKFSTVQVSSILWSTSSTTKDFNFDVGSCFLRCALEMFDQSTSFKMSLVPPKGFLWFLDLRKCLTLMVSNVSVFILMYLFITCFQSTQLLLFSESFF